MISKIVALFIVLAGIIFTSAALADPEKDFENCKYGGPAPSAKAAVAACTRIINGGKEGGERLSLAYTNRCEHDIGTKDQAIADCSRAIALNPRSARAYQLRGDKYLNKELLDRALADFTKSAELDPLSKENGFVYYGLYYIHMKRGLYDAALADMAMWAKTDPKDEDPYRFSAQIHEKFKRYDLALKDRTKAIEVMPDSPHVYADRADLYRKMDRLSDALQDAEKAVKLRPDNGLFYECRANVLVALGRREEAIADYRKALSFDNSNRGIKERLEKLGISAN